jgi:hypothetical protein
MVRTSVPIFRGGVNVAGVCLLSNADNIGDSVRFLQSTIVVSRDNFLSVRVYQCKSF